MKTLTLIAGLTLFLPSCIEEETVTTFFRPDGSLKQVLEFVTDRKDFSPSGLATPLDSTWQVEVRRDTADTSRYRVVATKNYLSVKELNDAYRHATGLMKGVKREVSFEKKFMWFYTFYYYQETVYAVFDGKELQEFVSPEELRYLQSDGEWLPPRLEGKDSTLIRAFSRTAQSHFTEWMGSRYFERWWKGMMRLAKDRPTDRFTPERLEEMRDTLRTIYCRTFFDLPGNDELPSFFLAGFGLDPLTLLHRYPVYFREFRELEEKTFFMADYENRVVLPGKMFDTNADVVEDGRPVWHVLPTRFLPEDFDMFAASREPNPWAWVVAVLVLIFAGVMFFPKKKGVRR